MSDVDTNSSDNVRGGAAGDILDPGSTALQSLPPLFWPNEPSLRVTPSHASLPALHALTYITDSIIPSTASASASAPVHSEGDLDHGSHLGGIDTADSGSDSGSDLGEWGCECSRSGSAPASGPSLGVSADQDANGATCSAGDGDQCECVATFGNFYNRNTNVLNLDALPERLPLVECGEACVCRAECSNRVTQRGLRIPIHVRPLGSIMGLGAFYDGREVLERGTFICLYAGEYLSTEEANARWPSSSASPNTSRAGDGNYILTLRLPGQRIHIDPRYKGNAGRFFNHSCDPSCVVHVVRWGGSSLWPRAAILAKRDILPDEELTYDYADASGSGPTGATGDGSRDRSVQEPQKGTTPCLCGAARCRGWMPYDPDV